MSIYTEMLKEIASFSGKIDRATVAQRPHIDPIPPRRCRTAPRKKVVDK